MPVEIINTPFDIELYGYSGYALNRSYGPTDSKLMDAMWKEVKSKGLKNKGINHWVYEKDDLLFTGVELEQIPTDTPMEIKKIYLPKYARYKHIGPYSRLGEAYANLKNELDSKKIRYHLPYLEIYGHWNSDETKLETDIIFAID